MNAVEMKEKLKSPEARAIFRDLYQKGNLDEHLKRYELLLDVYTDTFGDDPVELFSSPGRVEVIGNHTDHNNGKVVCTSIDMDCICVASKTDNGIIEINDITYQDQIRIDVNDIAKTGATDTVALIKGMLSGFSEFGYRIGGFNATISSKVIPAAGLSSSAAFEMLICTIMNHLYNEAAIDVVTCCKIGKYAENVYWDKQSGMLDQMACGVGGLVTIDFKDAAPVIEKLDSQFILEQYEIIIVNTGKSHADLNSEYSSIPIEMRNAAKALGKEVCREITMEEVQENLNQIREQAKDRGLLRALHFLTENQRVDRMVEAIRKQNPDIFLACVTESGNSSWKWLQNCYMATGDEQGITVALALTELFIQGQGAGACRVHGGGFAGVIMAVLPKQAAAEYTGYMKKHFGESNVFSMGIRKYGALKVMV